MDKSIEPIAAYMSAFAEHALEDCLQDLLDIIRLRQNLSPSHPKIFKVALAATAAAHGTEILIKSAIAKEHPLLLFPNNKSFGKHMRKSVPLDLSHLFDGETIIFSDLPQTLWAATGFSMTESALSKFEDFRKLRNKIEHFSAPGDSPSVHMVKQIIDFLFTVANPVLEHFWHCDLLTLVRPFGVTAFRKYLSHHGIAYSKPNWLVDFDEQTETGELDRLNIYRQQHESAAKISTQPISSSIVGIASIVPIEEVANANRRMCRIDDNILSSGTYSVPVGEIGHRTTTYLGSNWSAMTWEEAYYTIRLLRRHNGKWSYSNAYNVSGVPIKTFHELCEQNGLHIIPPLSPLSLFHNSQPCSSEETNQCDYATAGTFGIT